MTTLLRRGATIYNYTDSDVLLLSIDVPSTLSLYVDANGSITLSEIIDFFLRAGVYVDFDGYEEIKFSSLDTKVIGDLVAYDEDLMSLLGLENETTEINSLWGFSNNPGTCRLQLDDAYGSVSSRYEFIGRARIKGRVTLSGKTYNNLMPGLPPIWRITTDGLPDDLERYRTDFLENSCNDDCVVIGGWIGLGYPTVKAHGDDSYIAESISNSLFSTKTIVSEYLEDGYMEAIQTVSRDFDASTTSIDSPIKLDVAMTSDGNNVDVQIWGNRTGSSSFGSIARFSKDLYFITVKTGVFRGSYDTFKCDGYVYSIGNKLCRCYCTGSLSYGSTISGITNGTIIGVDSTHVYYAYETSLGITVAKSPIDDLSTIDASYLFSGSTDLGGGYIDDDYVYFTLNNSGDRRLVKLSQSSIGLSSWIYLMEYATYDKIDSTSGLTVLKTMDTTIIEDPELISGNLIDHSLSGGALIVAPKGFDSKQIKVDGSNYVFCNNVNGEVILYIIHKSSTGYSFKEFDRISIDLQDFDIAHVSSFGQNFLFICLLKTDGSVTIKRYNIGLKWQSL